MEIPQYLYEVGLNSKNYIERHFKDLLIESIDFIKFSMYFDLGPREYKLKLELIKKLSDEFT